MVHITYLFAGEWKYLHKYGLFTDEDDTRSSRNVLLRKILRIQWTVHVNIEEVFEKMETKRMMHFRYLGRIMMSVEIFRSYNEEKCLGKSDTHTHIWSPHGDVMVRKTLARTITTE